MKVLVFGSLAYDRIMNFPGLFGEHVIAGKEHEINVSFMVENLNESFGGTAGNIAYTLTLLGIETAIVARVGNDFGPYRAWLTEHGIDTSLIEIDRGKLAPKVYDVPDEIEKRVADFKLASMDVSIDTLTLEQKKYLRAGVRGRRTAIAHQRWLRKYSSACCTSFSIAC